MTDFRAGRFARETLGRGLRQICPARAVSTVLDVVPADLARDGKKLVLLDIDNTLMPWRGETVPEESRAWVAQLKDAGLEVCVLSNTRRVARLERTAQQLGVAYLRGRFKPSRRMYEQALARFGVQAREAVMVGDQLFTDVWGANRSGIEAIWVQPVATREFVGTKMNRLGERLVRRSLYKALEEEVRHG